MVSEKWFEWDTEKTAEETTPPEQNTASTAPPSDAEAALSPSPSDWKEPQPETTVEATESSPSSGMELATPRAAIPAQRPFTLWIEGQFTAEDREKIQELLEREDFGIREVDLELQWETGRILLPQVSEYAAMRVAQTLRESALELSMQANMAAADGPSFQKAPSTPSRHPAETIPITSQESVETAQPSESWATIDTILVTGLLKEPEWKAEQTDAFAKLVESLKRELRYRAHIKRAEALIRFKAEVLTSPWPSASECRVQVSALAVRKL
jgi:hypothetical protein